MHSFDSSHRQTQTQWPDPLAGGELWNPGSWALPATTLSVASLVAFVGVLAFTLRSELMRTLFVLPFHPAFFSVPAAALAWFIALTCRNRPGRHFPRYWVLILAVGASAVAAASLLPEPGRQPWLHNLVLATAAAVLTLTPRLVRVAPDSRLVQSIATLSLVGVLVLVLPSAFVIGRGAVERQRHRVETHLRALCDGTAEVRQATGYDWSRMAENPPAAAAVVEPLSQMQLDQVTADPTLWRIAATLGLAEELAATAEELMESLAGGLSPDRAPQLSALPEPAVWWDHERKRWVASAAFPALSRTTGEYHRQLGRLFQELAPDGAAVPAGLARRHRELQEELRSALEQQASSFSDGWIVESLPGELGSPPPPLVEVLQASLLEDPSESLAPADLGQLMRMTLGRTQVLARRAPGCKERTYEEGSYEYSRLDCYAYRPAGEDGGADLRVEMRLVYRSRPARELGSWEKPAEVFFLFPVPAGEEGIGAAERYAQQVMSELAAAVGRLWNGGVRPADRGGTHHLGFRLVADDGEGLRVYRPRVVTFVDERYAVEVRAERS